MFGSDTVWFPPIPLSPPLPFNYVIVLQPPSLTSWTSPTGYAPSTLFTQLDFLVNCQPDLRLGSLRASIEKKRKFGFETIYWLVSYWLCCSLYTFPPSKSNPSPVVVAYLALYIQIFFFLFSLCVNFFLFPKKIHCARVLCWIIIQCWSELLISCHINVNH